MSHPLRRLGRAALDALAEGLRTGRLAPPYNRSALAPHTPHEHLDAVVALLNEMHIDGMGARHIARTLALLAEERAAAQIVSDRIELVWSPSELDHVDCRDTSVVVQDLFRQAKHSVLIVTFVFDQGVKAEAIFGELAERMDADPKLAVRVIVNVKRNYGDDTPAATLERAFAKRLRDLVWPGERLPEVYYDPRSLDLDEHEHAVLHAKCVVIDNRQTFVTSANFTEAAQQRNIEVGVLIDDRVLSERVTLQFERLIEAGALRRLKV